MPVYLLVFSTVSDVRRIYTRNYTIATIEMYSKAKPISSLQGFVNLLSRPDSIGYVTFVCVVSAIGLCGRYV